MSEQSTEADERSKWKSPFVAGARVAVESRYAGGYREAFVDRVYKNGNFTLKGDDSRQQWRPNSWREYGTDNIRHSAHQTGRGSWSTGSLEIWDAETDAKIGAGVALQKRRVRLAAVARVVAGLRAEDITDEMLAKIEAALEPAADESQPKP